MHCRLATEPVYAAGTDIHLLLLSGGLGNGKYRLMVRPSVTDLVGNPFDGDGNGVGGDAYVQTFGIQSLWQPEGPYNGHRGGAGPLALAEDPAGSGYYLGFGCGAIDPSGDYDCGSSRRGPGTGWRWPWTRRGEAAIRK